MGRSTGKKIFFLYAHSVIQDELINDIIENEYEVYLVNDHKTVIPVLKRYDDSILFINIDEVQKEDEWLKYVSALMQNKETENIRIGILTYNSNEALARKYLMDLMVPCGYVTMKIGIEKSRRILLKTLEVNEARGERRYVRAQCEDVKSAELNFKYRGRLISGRINDISIVGLSCYFNEPVDLLVNTLLKDIQLKLKGTICRANGVIFGKRQQPDNAVLYVLLFNKGFSGDTKHRIHLFIHNTLQSQMERTVRELCSPS